MALNLSDPVKDDGIRVRSREVKKWLKKHHMKSNAANIAYAASVIRADKKRKRAPRGRESSYVAQETPWPIVYGTTRIPGIITFVHTSADKQYLHLVCTVAAHKINAITGVYMDDHLLTFNGAGLSTGPIVDDINYNGLVLYKADKLGDPDQTVQSDLAAALPTFWTANHRQRNRALVYVKLKFDGVAFANGFPRIEFLVQGKPVYDPRSTLTTFSANAALVIADYLTDSVYGLGYAWADLDSTSLIAAANICDESVPIRAGGTEARYQINGWFSASDSAKSTLEEMADAMAGAVVQTNGGWKFIPGSYTTPVSLTLTDDDLRSDVKLDTLISRSDNANSIKGQFIDPTNKYEPRDFPAVSVAAYVTEDAGEVVWEERTYNFTTSAPAAQRIARIDLERTRRPITLSASFSLKAYALEVGDNVYVTIDRYGFSSKVFEVLDYQLSLDTDQEITVDLTLRENDSGAYSWNETIDEQSVNQAPATTLPSPSVITAPTNLALASGTTWLDIRLDGTIFSRIHLTWTAPNDYFVLSGGRIEIGYKKSVDASWISAAPVPGDATMANILDVEDSAAYDVRIRSVNNMGAMSSWVTVSAYQVIGKTELPSDVNGLTGAVTNYGIDLSWNKISDLDVGFYEIRVGSSWAAGTLVAQVKGTHYTREALAAGTYTYRIKAVDTTGNYSTNDATTIISIAAPSAPSGTLSFSGENVVLDWTESSGDFAIADYTVSYGATYAGSTEIVRTKATAYTVKGDWSGSRNFWVVAYDIVGNASDPLQLIATIVVPPAVSSLIADVIDNNVLLKWTASAGGSLAVDYYKVMRGATYGGATYIGAVKGTFAPIFETSGGDFVYWIVPVDSAGNLGTEKAVAAAVLSPPDFDILLSQSLTGGTATNFYKDADGTLYGAVDILETWETHFTSRGYTCPQDQIDAGFPYYLEPSLSYGEWYKDVDLGTTLDGCVVRLNAAPINIVGAPDLVPYIWTSADGVNWLKNDDVWSAYATSFRYVRAGYRIGTGATGSATRRRSTIGILGLVLPDPDNDISAEDRRALSGVYSGEMSGPGDGVVRIDSSQLRLDVKIISDRGAGTSSASAPTTVTFNTTFRDVRMIQVSANSTTEKKPVYDFNGATLNPTSFDVYIFDSGGNQVACDFSWSAEGI